MLISDAPGTTKTPRGHLINMAGLGIDFLHCGLFGSYADGCQSVYVILVSKMNACDLVTVGNVWIPCAGVTRCPALNMVVSIRGALDRKNRYAAQ